MSKARLASFSDAVFAIICTLLVVSLEVPEFGPRHHDRTLLDSLIGMAPSFASYVLSFALVTFYWVAHHDLLSIVRQVNAGFTWINNFFLMWLALLPFPTEIMGRYPHNEIAVLFFGLITFLAAVTFIALGICLLITHNLREPEYETRCLAISLRNSGIGIGVYFVALLVSYFSDWITMTMYGLIPFLFLVPMRIRRLAPAR